ncbi:hypothetical protein DSM104443_01157 [Usitatibacter rugosus]|uniref:Uncharacterized protein n=1 Tax=Usitatibacter rugosus TaxID=2732067 RepID=A0A6M4GUE7_9PROT|nr:hypothetical protein DSM104443_01157 [Usitatibacter rugosus]
MPPILDKLTTPTPLRSLVARRKARALMSFPNGARPLICAWGAALRYESSLGNLRD